jgi:hypothetical protein
MEHMRKDYKAFLSFIPVVCVVVGLFILPSYVFCSEDIASPLANDTLKIIEAENHTRNVFVWKEDTWQNLTNFRNPHYIYAHEISDDRKYAFVWHEDHPPRTLSIYDLQKMKLVRNLKLGFGGDVKWNQENNIVHVYGCGSGCMAARLLNIEWKILFEIAGSPIDISPSGRYLVIFTINWVGKQDVELYDLFQKNLISDKKPLLVIKGVGNLDSINWNDERKLTIIYTDAYFENDNYIKREFSIDLTQY